MSKVPNSARKESSNISHKYLKASETTFQIWRKKLYLFLTETVDIPQEEDYDSRKIIPLISGQRDDEDEENENSQISSSEHGDQAFVIDDDVEAQEDIDEDFAFVDEDIWFTLINPTTLCFRSYKKETVYFRTSLLPNRILFARLSSTILLILLMINYSVLSTALGVDIWGITLGLCLILFFSVWIEKGKYYIEAYLNAKKNRWFILLLEMSVLFSASLFDFAISEMHFHIVGPTSLIVASYLAICCGLTITFLETIGGMAILLIIALIKLLMLAAENKDPILACVIYGVPLLINAVIIWGLIYPSDQLRRLRYLKSLCIETQLAQMKQERQKTDYLLSLSLPKSIVSKLRDSGTTGLIVEKFSDSCVMFGDLKNFKDVAHMISMKEAVIVLNGVFEHIDDLLVNFPTLEKIKTISSKILIVGGINKIHNMFLKEMTELALNLVEYFLESKDYDVENETISVKLDMAFGIAYGPIVAGIVGKKKFVYEIYGDTVNTSSRMCSLAKGNDIVVTEKCYELSIDDFNSEYLGEKYVKGKGEVPVYSIISTKNRSENNIRKYASSDLLSSKMSIGDLVKSVISRSEELINDKYTMEAEESSHLSKQASDIYKDVKDVASTRTKSSSEILKSSHSITNSKTDDSQHLLQDEEIEQPSEPIKENYDISENEVKKSTHSILSNNNQNELIELDDLNHASEHNENPKSEHYILLENASKASEKSLKENIDLEAVAKSEHSISFDASQTSVKSLKELEAAIKSEHSISVKDTDASKTSVKSLKENIELEAAIKSEHSISVKDTEASNNIQNIEEKAIQSSSLINIENHIDVVEANKSSHSISVPEDAVNLSNINGAIDSENEIIEFHQSTPLNEITDLQNAGIENKDSSHKSLISIYLENELPSIPTNAENDDIKEAFTSIKMETEDVKISKDMLAKDEIQKSQSSLKDVIEGKILKSLLTNTSGVMTSIPSINSNSESHERLQTVSSLKRSRGSSNKGKFEKKISFDRRGSIFPQSILEKKTGSAFDKELELSAGNLTGPEQGRLADKLIIAGPQKEDGLLDVAKLGLKGMKPAGEEKDDKNGKEKVMRQFNENSEEAKEVVIDVIMRMVRKVGSKTNKSKKGSSSEKYFKEIYEEMEDFSLGFKHSSLENQFIMDFNSVSGWAFLRSTLQVFVIEALIIFIAVFNSVQTGRPILGDSKLLSFALAAGVGALGFQALVCGITVFSAGEEETSPEFSTRMIHLSTSVLTLIVVAILCTLPWTGLQSYLFLTGGVIPHLCIFMLMRMDGILFIYKLMISFIVGLVLIILQLALNQSTWSIALSVLFPILLWAFSFHKLERSTRTEYLIDAIMETQADLVAEEILKSAVVLHSILPQAVINKLLMEPNSIVYEEFEIMTVLQLDIAGFTAMSSTLEPAVIIEMLNTLFIYFDHLTEEFNVEKITTIGDAYVACSTFNPSANPKTGAISICLVGLQMQQYLGQQLNESAFVKRNIKAPIKMRVGIHTGTAVGAIMGGPKNFRYDLLGDTVLIAEKIQEIAPLGGVYISETTYSQVKDYHGFKFSSKPDSMYNTMSVYWLRAYDEKHQNNSELDLTAPLKSAQAVVQDAGTKGASRKALPKASMKSNKPPKVQRANTNLGNIENGNH